jgi:hypothetical protein
MAWPSSRREYNAIDEVSQFGVMHCPELQAIACEIMNL